jgi:hypothetical protein
MSISRRLVAVCTIAALAFVACGSDEPAEDQTSVHAGHGSSSAAPVANACPAEGCTIKILDAALDGNEIKLTWKANFKPDVSRNHIHVYWDIYTADQVSSDAEARGVTQGEWVPTDAYPTYTTDSAVSVSKRGGSTVICVTAGDRDHAVIDSSLVDCLDVSDLL